MLYIFSVLSGSIASRPLGGGRFRALTFLYCTFRDQGKLNNLKFEWLYMFLRSVSTLFSFPFSLFSPKNNPKRWNSSFFIISLGPMPKRPVSLKISLDDAAAPEPGEAVSVFLSNASSDGRDPSSSISSHQQWAVLCPEHVEFIQEGAAAGPDTLGRGSSGAVHRARNHLTGEWIAVKEIPMTDGQHADEIQREIAVLAAPSDAEDSKYIIRFLGAFVPRGSNVVCVAMELMDGSLADLVAMKGSLPSLVVAGMVVSILRGLRYLHDSKHVLHRDLKPSNVLFRKRTGEVKIADFGVSADARKG